MNNSSLTKKVLADNISNKIDVSQKQALEYLECLMEIIKETLETGETVKVTGFGSFIVNGKDDRVGRNPQTGEAITIKARKVVTFKASNLLKDAINPDNR